LVNRPVKKKLEKDWISLKGREAKTMKSIGELFERKRGGYL